MLAFFCRISDWQRRHRATPPTAFDAALPTPGPGGVPPSLSIGVKKFQTMECFTLAGSILPAILAARRSIPHCR